MYKKAKIRWFIDNSSLNIKKNSIEYLIIDSSNIEMKEESIIKHIEKHLFEKYQIKFINCQDFIIENLDQFFEF